MEKTCLDQNFDPSNFCDLRRRPSLLYPREAMVSVELCPDKCFRLMAKPLLLQELYWKVRKRVKIDPKMEEKTVSVLIDD